LNVFVDLVAPQWGTMEERAHHPGGCTVFPGGIPGGRISKCCKRFPHRAGTAR
jgi:hypothetical protein